MKQRNKAILITIAIFLSFLFIGLLFYWFPTIMMPLLIMVSSIVFIKSVYTITLLKIKKNDDTKTDYN